MFSFYGTEMTHLGDTPTPPSALFATVMTGAEDYEVDITLALTASIDWGDAATLGDGLGTEGTIQFYDANGLWQLLTAFPTDTTFTVTIPYGDPADIIAVWLRAVNLQGVLGTITQYSVALGESEIPGGNAWYNAGFWDDLQAWVDTGTWNDTAA